MNVPARNPTTPQNTVAEFVQKSHVAALDFTYDVTHDWSVGGKYAYRLGQFVAAEDWARKATRVPNCQYWGYAHRVAALGYLPRPAEKEAALRDLFKLKPHFTCALAERRLFYVRDASHIARYVEGLRRAGVPEN